MKEGMPGRHADKEGDKGGQGDGRQAGNTHGYMQQVKWEEGMHTVREGRREAYRKERGREGCCGTWAERTSWREGGPMGETFSRKSGLIV